MDTITLKLKPKYREEIELILQTDKESDYFDIPNGKEMVYNDNPYLFFNSPSYLSFIIPENNATNALLQSTKDRKMLNCLNCIIFWNCYKNISKSPFIT